MVLYSLYFKFAVHCPTDWEKLHPLSRAGQIHNASSRQPKRCNI